MAVMGRSQQKDRDKDQDGADRDQRGDQRIWSKPMLRPKACSSVWRRKKAVVAGIITTKVVTLIPPAVEVGPPRSA